MRNAGIVDISRSVDDKLDLTRPLVHTKKFSCEQSPSDIRMIETLTSDNCAHDAARLEFTKASLNADLQAADCNRAEELGRK